MSEKLKLLERWEKHYINTDNAYELLHAAFNATPDSPAIEPTWRLFDDYTNLVAEIVGDNDGWLGWYHCDNDFGKNGLSAKAAKWKTKRPIRSLKTLLKLIEDSKR